jgi:hypothetical protein
VASVEVGGRNAGYFLNINRPIINVTTPIKPWTIESVRNKFRLEFEFKAKTIKPIVVAKEIKEIALNLFPNFEVVSFLNLNGIRKVSSSTKQANTNRSIHASSVVGGMWK